MGQMVELVIGVWEQVGNGGWLFLEDPTERKYEVMVHESQTYASLLDLVRTRYSVGVNISVGLTYEFPEWMKVPGDISTPPVDVREDGDVELFMSIRLDVGDLRLCVTIGNDAVARYLFQRRSNYTVIGSSRGTLAPKPFPYRGNDIYKNNSSTCVDDLHGNLTDGAAFWEGMLGQGWISASQQFMMEVCSEDETAMLTNKALALTRGSEVQVEESSEGTESSTNSSAAPLNVVGQTAGSGIIRVPDTNPLLGWANQPLTIGVPQRRPVSIIEYLTKGKGKVADYRVAGSTDGGHYVEKTTTDDNHKILDPSPEEDSEEEVSQEGGREHLYVGQVFMDRTAFKTHMALYALANKFRFVNRRSEPGKMVLECRGEDCKWRVSAVKLAGCPRFQIKRLGGDHSCTVDERGDFRRHATSTLIGEMVKSKFAGVGSRPRPGTLREFMRTDHQVPISYWKAWKSRKLAMDRGLGNTTDSYRLLLSYLEQLTLSNPGSLVSIETTRGEGGIQRFKYLFLSLAACAKGYAYMRKVVVVDGTHLKGKYVGCLLTASAQDGNYQIFPIAFAVVDGENDQSWTWFFEKLLDVVEDGYDLLFVSDRHQSIYAGLRKMYPRAKHCACVLHLQRNIVTTFKKKHLAYLVSKAARAFKVSDFYKHFNEIKMVDIDCADYLIRVGFEHWTRSHCHGLRYNIMTSNVAESLNAALVDAREFPIVPLVEYIRSMLMGWFSGRREAASRCGGVVTPKVEELISKSFSISTGLLVRHINKSEFEVRGVDGVPFMVDLEKKVCSCLEFDMLLIPCVHAVAAAIQSNGRVDALVGEKYTRNTWASAYSMSINPTGNYFTPPAEPGSLGSLQLAPPNTRRPPGRPKKSRFLSRGEFSRGVLGRRVRSCTRCGGANHNRATCKAPI